MGLLGPTTWVGGTMGSPVGGGGDRRDSEVPRQQWEEVRGPSMVVGRSLGSHGGGGRESGVLWHRGV